MAAIGAFAAADYFFIPPRYGFALNSAIVATLAGYSVSCGVIIYFGELMHRTVRKAAERMQGKTGVDSRPGKGSCFWVQLPLASPDTEPE